MKRHSKLSVKLSGWSGICWPGGASLGLWPKEWSEGHPKSLSGLLMLMLQKRSIPRSLCSAQVETACRGTWLTQEWVWSKSSEQSAQKFHLHQPIPCRLLCCHMGITDHKISGPHIDFTPSHVHLRVDCSIQKSLRTHWHYCYACSEGSCISWEPSWCTWNLVVRRASNPDESAWMRRFSQLFR